MDREAAKIRHPVLLGNSGARRAGKPIRPHLHPDSERLRRSPGRNRLAITWSVLACELFLILNSPGCSDSQPGQKVRGASEQPAASAAQATTTATAAHSSSTTPTSGANFHPVPLDPFYQRQFADYRSTESWAQVPRGETNFDGVPFLMFGKIDLTGLGRARDGEFQPARVGEIPVGRRATRLHLIHGASYDSPHDTPMAAVLLRYESGEAQRLFLRYGVHVRNWYVEARETDPTLSDPRSLVIWNGTTRPDGSGTPTRLFKTTFDNPLPAQEIRAIELLSLFARANSVILAITLEDSPSAAPPTMEDNDDSEFRREDSLRVSDTDTGQPIPNAAIRLSVTEGARTYRFGAYRSDARGQIRIDYPPGRFQAFIVDATAPGYSPVNLEILNDDGFLGPDLPVRLKREPAPQREP
jgi:hypothetical protein